MNKEESLMIILKSSFQKEIFQRLIKVYKGSLRSSHVLNIPASSIRGYKNLYFNCVPKYLINRLIKLKIVNSDEIRKNFRSSFIKDKKIKEILKYGREERNKRLKNIKKAIPPIKKLMIHDYLDFNLWFDKYRLLLDSGFRKIKIDYKKDDIIVRYSNFTKNGFKNFKVKLPKKILLDDEFIYFFGLWCGDRVGGKRFGVCNKNKEIIKFTEHFLKKYSRKIEKMLYITKGMAEPNIRYDKKYVMDRDIKGWALSVYCSNGIMTSFFNYIKLHLKEFLVINKRYEPFFAGLFDAEGNVSLHNKSFRWACKNDQLVSIYTKFLKKLDLYDRYDGDCIISYNKNQFFNKIFPYLKHSEKINLTKLLCTGKGDLPIDYLKILDNIKKHPKITEKELAKTLKKVKVYSELKILSDFGFISYEGYPHNFGITSKGLKSIGG